MVPFNKEGAAGSAINWEFPAVVESRKVLWQTVLRQLVRQYDDAVSRLQRSRSIIRQPDQLLRLRHYSYLLVVKLWHFFDFPNVWRNGGVVDECFSNRSQPPTRLRYYFDPIFIIHIFIPLYYFSNISLVGYYIIFIQYPSSANLHPMSQYDTRAWLMKLVRFDASFGNVLWCRRFNPEVGGQFWRVYMIPNLGGRHSPVMVRYRQPSWTCELWIVLCAFAPWISTLVL